MANDVVDVPGHPLALADDVQLALEPLVLALLLVDPPDDPGEESDAEVDDEEEPQL